MRDGKERKVTSKKNGHTCFVDTRRPADSLDTLKQKDDDDEGIPIATTKVISYKS
jgi:hypothetical protein